MQAYLLTHIQMHVEWFRVTVVTAVGVVQMTEKPYTMITITTPNCDVT